jgi:hypothetical protein
VVFSKLNFNLILLFSIISTNDSHASLLALINSIVLVRFSIEDNIILAQIFNTDFRIIPCQVIPISSLKNQIILKNNF